MRDRSRVPDQRPYPRGATTHELHVLEYLHRAAQMMPDREFVPDVVGALHLIVSLIGQRNRGRAFHQAIDDQNEESG